MAIRIDEHIESTDKSGKRILMWWNLMQRGGKINIFIHDDNGPTGVEYSIRLSSAIKIIAFLGKAIVEINDRIRKGVALR